MKVIEKLSLRRWLIWASQESLTKKDEDLMEGRGAWIAEDNDFEEVRMFR